MTKINDSKWSKYISHGNAVHAAVDDVSNKKGLRFGTVLGVIATSVVLAFIGATLAAEFTRTLS